MPYLDSRELADRLEELEKQDEDEDATPLDEDERDEMESLLSLKNEISEWFDGATLVPEDEFEDYAREMAEDIGAINSSAGWPLHCIDWEWAARELAMDYSSVEYDGITYLVRS